MGILHHRARAMACTWVPSKSLYFGHHVDYYVTTLGYYFIILWVTSHYVISALAYHDTIPIFPYLTSRRVDVTSTSDYRVTILGCHWTMHEFTSLFLDAVSFAHIITTKGHISTLVHRSVTAHDITIRKIHHQHLLISVKEMYKIHYIIKGLRKLWRLKSQTQFHPPWLTFYCSSLRTFLVIPSYYIS